MNMNEKYLKLLENKTTADEEFDSLVLFRLRRNAELVRCVARKMNLNAAEYPESLKWTTETKKMHFVSANENEIVVSFYNEKLGAPQTVTTYKIPRKWIHLSTWDICALTRHTIRVNRACSLSKQIVESKREIEKTSLTMKNEILRLTQRSEKELAKQEADQSLRIKQLKNLKEKYNV